MDILRLAADRPSLTLLTRVAPALLAAWRAGAVLDALVVSTDAGKGMARLRVEGRELDVRTEVPLQPRQRLSLTAEPQPGHWRLRVLPTAEQSTLEQALRQVLPRQQPLAPALHTLTRAAADTRLPLPVRALAERLAGQIPAPQRLATPEGLRQAVERSGVFLESRLATPTTTASTPPAVAAPPGTSTPPLPPLSPTALPATTLPALPGLAPASGEDPVGSDFKGLLLRLLSLLRAPAGTRAEEAPDEHARAATDTLQALARQAEGALARIELHQLRALPEGPDREPAWVLELPFRQGENLETLTLRIRREPEREGATGAVAPWTVTLEIGSGDTALRAVIALRGPAVSTRFFAEHGALAERIRASLGLLDTRLRAAGLEVETLEAHTGRAISEEPLPAGLLRERV